MTQAELGTSSSLHPAGVEAALAAELFWIMAIGAAIVWALTMAAALYAAYGRRKDGQARRRTAMFLIVGGGLIAPTVVLGALLTYGLSTLVGLQGDGDGLRIAVTGERFWWRVQYAPGTEARIDLANEIRLPVGRRTELLLNSPEVIHSLWIPALAGKVDMLPGRQTRLVLEPTRVGRYRGICAEYCGTGHAHMTFTVDVLAADEFAAWLEQQRNSARLPDTAHTRDGAAAFVSYGCPACHTIRGTAARGVIGPDLSHVGGRPTLSATDLAMDDASLQRWIRNPAAIKPGALMPGFSMIKDDDIAVLTSYLLSLK
ncbi:MAG: cytochrome c oxidase subunit II [Panacagrimonas sp.]